MLWKHLLNLILKNNKQGSFDNKTAFLTIYTKKEKHYEQRKNVF